MRLRSHWLSSVVLIVTCLGGLPLLRRFDAGRSSAALEHSRYGRRLAGVAVTPDSASASVTADGTGWTAVYTVTNNTGSSGTWNFACSATGQLTCVSVQPTSVSIGTVDNQENVTVTFSSGAISNPSGNILTLTATGPATDAGSYLVRVFPSLVRTVTPGGIVQDGMTIVRRHTPVVLARFMLSNGYVTDSTQTLLTWQKLPSGTLDTVTSLARVNRGLIEWEVDSARGLINAGDSARVTFRHCVTIGACTTERRFVKLANDSKPLFDFSGVSLEALGAGFSTPFGGGFSVTGAEVETGFSTVPYFSMGQARSAGLVYSTRQAYPRVVLPIDLEFPWLGAGNPSSLKLVAIDAGVRQDSVSYTSPVCHTGSVPKCRAVLAVDFSNLTLSTPVRKWLQIEATVNGNIISTDSVEVALVDRRTTRYGAGWWPAGASQMFAAGEDRILVSPSGSATVFRGNGDSLYLPPPGSFSVLKKLATTWELSPRGSLAKAVFDAQGRLAASIDQNGNADSIFYGGTTDSVLSIKDPVGKSITLTYTSGKLSKFSSLSGVALRDHLVTIDATTNQLRVDSISGTQFATRYGYDTVTIASKTFLVSRRIGVIADTSHVVYETAASFLRRPKQLELPRVPDENGALQLPVISYTPVERRGAGTVVPLDSTGPWVEMKDPRGNWTRSYVTKWGQARLTWDTLGTLGRSAYAPDGRVLWSAGKVAGDNSRVYYSYDNLQRLVKSYIVRVERTPVDTLRSDSLVYDANHRVIRRIDNRGKIDSIWYDAKGNVTKTKDPAGYVTQSWYRSDGLVDSVRPPSTSLATRYTYDATWKRVTETYTGNTLLSQSAYDKFGRDSLSESRVKVQVTATDTAWQWRRTIPTYTAVNQVTASTLYRTDTCTPCSAPPTYPTDSLHARQLQYVRDRAGRDSLRLNERGQATAYLYDRLGRLIRRTPPSTGGTPPRDSMAYDVTGNLRKTFTRRGDSIITLYDSRNRDTSTTIPGVGTRKKAFGGLLDQLSSLWYASPVDSIGGVNSGAGYRYDTRGRLLTDTAFVGSTAVTVARTYDVLDRDSITSDIQGDWALRYDSYRGLPEKLVTPYSDSTSLTIDGVGRVTTHAVASSGPAFTKSVSFASTGKVSFITHTAGSPSFEAGKFDAVGLDDDTPPANGPVWTEQHGSGVAADSMVDSLRYDGWERLISWRGFRRSGIKWLATATDSVWFDRVGNVYVNGESRWYNAVTDRLDSLLVAGWKWKYSYDPAGNLIQADGDSSTSSRRWKYGYDALNQLRSARYKAAAWPTDSLVARYGYDVLGRRIAKRVYRNPVGGDVGYLRYVLRGGQVSYETDSAGTTQRRYEWGPGTDNLVGFQEKKTPTVWNSYYVVQDQLGTVRGLVDRGGSWVMSQRFMPYGTRLSRDSVAGNPLPKLPYGWTGREFDAETGMYFNRARYYHPVLRRFTQEDPIGYRGGANLYEYAGGAVLEARDPSGMLALYIPPVGHEEVTPHGGGYLDRYKCMVFCQDIRDRQDQEMDEFFNHAAEGVWAENRCRTDVVACMAVIILGEARLGPTKHYSEKDMIEAFSWIASVMMKGSRGGAYNEDAMARQLLKPLRYDAANQPNFRNWMETGELPATSGAGGSRFMLARSVAAQHFYGISGDVTGGATNFATSGSPLSRNMQASANYQYTGSRGGNDFYIDTTLHH